jgi:hypothetical protein
MTFRSDAQKTESAAVAKISRDRRERIATAIMAGFAANPEVARDSTRSEAGYAALACVGADALIAELDKAR